MTSPGSAPPEAERRTARERRALLLVIVLLLSVTIAVSPLAFHDLPLLLLISAPFALTLLVSAAVAPLTRDAAAERDRRLEAAAVRTTRQTQAQRHAIRTPRVNTLPPEDPATLAAACIVATQQHGIHFGCAGMADEDFLQAFHAGEIRAASFRHGDHLRYTALMLRRVPPGLVEETIATNLRQFLRHVCGSEGLYHATRTHAWVTVLRSLPRASFAQWLTEHGNALRGDALFRFYSEDLLNSEAARQRALAPDRDPLPVRPAQPASHAPISSRT